VRHAGFALVVAILALTPGCGADESESSVAAEEANAPSTVERNRIEVVESQGDGGLDAAALYEGLSPGVVP